MNILNKNHITLSSPAEREEICAPLKKINIETFIYIKNYKNGKLIHLSNRGNWLEHFYERNFYKIGPFEKLKDIYKEGVLLWSHLSGKQVMREAKEYFNMAHGITIVEKNFDGSDEFYSFGAGKDNPEVVIFCLNNIDMLKRFILYFKCKAEKILKHAEQNKIILPDSKTIVTPKNKLIQKNSCVYKNKETDLRKIFFRETQIGRKAFQCKQEKNVFLTGRELEVAIFLLDHYSANEIGNLLHISKRTVESHLVNLKEKMHCYSQEELKKVLLQNGLGFFIAKDTRIAWR